MPLDPQKKAEVISAHRRHEKDTGSSHVQIAVLTERICHLTEHLKGAPKDYSTRRGLQKLVGQRSALLRYLARTNAATYQATIKRLGLRK